MNNYDNLEVLSSEEKRALLQKLLNQKNENIKMYPLSFKQEGLWFLQQLKPESALYNSPFAVSLKGKLDVALLEKGLNEIVKRHETMRTTINSIEGRPVQQVHPYKPFRLEMTDISEIEADRRESELMSRVYEEGRKPFDLKEGPLFRPSVIKVNEEEYVLMLIMHHIVSDSWSKSLIMKELGILYDAYKNKRTPLLPPLKIQYGEYARRHREWLQSEEAQLQLEYWKNNLANVPLIHSLPLDFERPEIGYYEGDSVEFEIDEDLAHKLKALCNTKGVTLYMILLTAFQILLSRWSGQDDIIVGTGVANRTRPELENLVGFFVNMLAMRSDFSDNLTFINQLEKVRDETLNAFANQEYPFERLVDELQPERSLSAAPIFQITFFLQNIVETASDFCGVDVEYFDMDYGVSKYDLSLILWEKMNRIIGGFSFNIKLFDKRTIQRLADQFLILLRGIVSNPNTTIKELPLITESEKNIVLKKFNHTKTVCNEEVRLHRLFETQASLHPERVALTFNGESMTYGDLNRRANCLASYLQVHGIKPGMAVGICLERSFEMVISQLAVLKMGAAYVPIDPSYPDERINYMLNESEISILLTQESVVSNLKNINSKKIIIDKEWQTITKYSYENLDVDVSSEDLAYIIFTSGSTGKPKGVMIPHRAVANIILWTIEEYKVTNEDVFLLRSPVSFDVSVWETYTPLVIGGRLVIAQPVLHRDIRYIAREIIEQNVTIIGIVPSILQLLADDELFPKCSSLRCIFCGAETLTRKLVERVKEQLSVKLINVYGPTEAAIDTVIYECLEELPNVIPIGRPVYNTEVYVLDSYMQPVPIGVVGELYLGGDNVGLGYINRPDLTAERFIEHPLLSAKGKKLYKTGDLVRFTKDGNLEFFGRADKQVKIHGQRVELDEIDEALRRCPGVYQVVTEIGVFNRLIAYLVSEPGTSLGPKELRMEIKKFLPEYMIPDEFVFLNELPLMPNGKVNRKELSKQRNIENKENLYEAPKTKLEQTIADIWMEVLHIDKVGLNDNFFEIGGNSLLIMVILSKIRRAINSEISVIDLFQYPTINKLAKHLNQGETAETQCESSEMRAKMRKELINRRRVITKRDSSLNHEKGE